MWPRRTITVSLLLLHLPVLSSCTYWKPAAPTPEQVGSQERAKIRTRSEREFVLRDPWVRNDSIGGRRKVLEGQWIRGDSAWASPLANVLEIRTKQRDTTRDVLLVVSGVGAAAGTALVIIGLTCCK